MGSFIARTRGHRVAIKTLLSLLNQSSELALTKGKLTVRAAGPSYNTYPDAQNTNTDTNTIANKTKIQRQIQIKSSEL